jgi:hypothetical protein
MKERSVDDMFLQLSLKLLIDALGLCHTSTYGAPTYQRRLKGQFSTSLRDTGRFELLKSMTVVESLLMKIIWGDPIPVFADVCTSNIRWQWNGWTSDDKPDLASILGRSTTDFEIR